MDLVTRRKFLKVLAGSAGSLALARYLQPSLLMAQTMGGGSGKNFVVINLFGGCDGMTMLPYYQGPASDRIHSYLRPTIGVPVGTIIPFTQQAGGADKIGLHPSLSKLSTAAASHMKIIQKYGIVNDPGRSHDTCQILFSLGRETVAGGDAQGVLARLMDQQNWESFQYWAIGNPPIPDVNTRGAAPIVLNELSSFNYGKLGAENDRDVDYAAETQRALLELQIPRNNAADHYKTTLQTMHRVVSVLRTDISAQNVGNNVAGNYAEQGLGPNFRDAAKILKAKSSSVEFGQRDKNTILYLGQGGYDTHSNQITDGGLPTLLTSLGNNLAVLIEDMKSFGIWENTTILVFSEFGRTTSENGTEGDSTVGTDHGWANNTFVAGGSIHPGVLGAPPSLSELNDRDTNALVPDIDFRRIWGDVLQWLDVSPSSILDEDNFSYSPLGIFS